MPKEDPNIAIAVTKSQLSEALARLGRIETKLDNQSNISRAEFDEFKKEIRDTYVTNDKIKPLINLFWSIVTLALGGVITLGFALFGGGK